VRSGLVRRLLRRDLARLLHEDEEPGWQPHRAAGDAEYRLAGSAWFDLRLRIVSKRTSEPLATLTAHQRWAVIGPGFLVVRVYHLDAPPSLDVLDRSRRLREVATQRIEFPRILELSAPEYLYEIVDATPHTAILLMTSPAICRYRWYFDRETLAPTTIGSTDRSASRLAAACKLIAALGDAESAPLDGVARLTTHPDHFVRWSAISSIARLDPAARRPLLERALSDPHPHVRSAARRTLEVDTSDGEPPWR
jgi:hypothetical protein